MITREQIPQVVGHPVHDAQGKKIGDAKHMYLDDATGDPEWVTVKTGFFGNNETFVPTRAARIVQDHLEVPYDKDQVKGAPNVDVDSGGHLSAEEERHLYRYYGLEGSRSGDGDGGRGEKAAAAGTAGTAAAAGGGRHAKPAGGEEGMPSRGADAGAAGAKGTQEEMAGSEAGVGTGTGTASFAAGTSGSAERVAPDAGADAMTRSEEELHVRVERQDAGQARLRKYVDVEEVEQTIPIRHEEVRLEREPITEANRGAARSGPDISEAEHVVTLHEDRPIVETEVVPKERVRMRVEEHVEQKTVHGRVRKERIETELSESAGEEKATGEAPGQGRDKRFR
jgi:stress response protein YsnF